MPRPMQQKTKGMKMTNHLSKNHLHMTGKEHPVAPHGTTTRNPWGALEVGDWFLAGASAYVISSVRNRRHTDREHRGVCSDGQNYVVRIK